MFWMSKLKLNLRKENMTKNQIKYQNWKNVNSFCCLPLLLAKTKILNELKIFVSEEEKCNRNDDVDKTKTGLFKRVDFS